MSWHQRILEKTADRTEYYCWDDDGHVGLRTVWNVEPVVEATKGVYNAFDTTKGWRGDLHHVASIPMAVIDEYKRVHGVNLLTDRAAVRRWCNDPANRCFRTRPGRI